MRDDLIVTLSKSELKDLIFDVFKDALRSEREAQEAKQNEVYLTREETINLLKISEVTLWKIDKKGLLDKKKIGRKVLYAKSSVLALQTTRL